MKLELKTIVKALTCDKDAVYGALFVLIKHPKNNIIISKISEKILFEIL